MISILLVDDHKMMREGLLKVLDHDRYMVVDQAENGAQAVEKYMEIKPDVVLMDLSLPVMDGLEASRKIIEHDPAARVLLLTMGGTDADILEAMELQVKGYLNKASSAEVLNNTISLIMADESVYPTDIFLKKKHGDAAFKELTPKEKEVLKEMARGKANKVIASALDISEGTVKVHIKSILKKLSVNNRTEAAILAYEKGVV